MKIQEKQDAPEVLQGYLTRDDLAKQMGVHPRTLERWHRERQGPPCVMIGRFRLYRVAAVREWLESREQGPTRSRAA